MKMIFAIINNDDAPNVVNNLTKANFSITKLATTGGFLSKGNSTILIGSEASRIDMAMDIIKEHSKHRPELIPNVSDMGIGCHAMPIEVPVGGATVFVVNVERFEKF